MQKVKKKKHHKIHKITKKDPKSAMYFKMENFNTYFLFWKINWSALVIRVQYNA